MKSKKIIRNLILSAIVGFAALNAHSQSVKQRMLNDMNNSTRFNSANEPSSSDEHQKNRNCTDGIRDVKALKQFGSEVVIQSGIGFKKITSSDELINFSEKSIPELCKQILANEVTKRSDYCYLTPEQARGLPDGAMSQNFPAKTKQAQEKCESELTAKIVIEKNLQIANAYKKIKSEELVIVERKEAQEKAERNIDVAKQTVRDFEIKGINLKSTKSQVVSKGDRTSWECFNNSSDQFSETCTIKFSVEKCWDEPLIKPSTGELLRMVSYCKKEFPEKMQSANQGFSTLGGAKIDNISVVFYKNQVSTLSVEIEKPSNDLEAGLIQKYGDPAIYTKSEATWFGKDEHLKVSGRYVTLQRPSIKQLFDDDRKSKIINDRLEAERKAKALSDQRKRDL